MEATRAKVARLAAPLRWAGGFLEGVAVCSALGGVIVGIAVAAQSRTTVASDFSDATTTHPYVQLGVGIAIAALISGVLYWGIARTIRVVGACSGLLGDASVAEKTEIDPTTGQPSAAAKTGEPTEADRQAWLAYYRETGVRHPDAQGAWDDLHRAERRGRATPKAKAIPTAEDAVAERSGTRTSTATRTRPIRARQTTRSATALEEK